MEINLRGFMKLFIFVILLSVFTNYVVKSQDLNVDQTLAYINKQLNDKNNKYSPIRVHDFVLVSEPSAFIRDRALMNDYSYNINIEHGLLIVKRILSKNNIARILEEWTAPIKEINDNQSGAGVHLDTRYDYSSGDDYSGEYSSEGGAVCVFIMGKKLYSDFVTKVSKEYNDEGIELYKKTKKEGSFSIKFSNKNLIADNLKNAFIHLINLTSNDSNYNTIDFVDNDPFAKPIIKDTVNQNSIKIINSNSIPMTKIGGVYEIPVLLNGVLKLNFIFDAGASDVSISPDVALTLIRTGTVTDKDFLGTETYRFADGSKAKSKVFIIKEIQLGSRKINNIKASISNSINAPLLLGQSALNKFGKVIIDYNKGVIVFQD